MSENGKTQIQTLAAGFFGFVGVVGLGSLLILHHGGGAPAKAPAFPAYAPVDVDSGAAPRPAAGAIAVSRAPLVAPDAAVSSPAPLLSAEERGAAAPAAPAPATASGDSKPATPAVAAKPAPQLAVGEHLDGSASASSSAAAAAAAPKPKAALAAAKKPVLDPKLPLPKDQSTVASSVHYGVSSRAELMGRAAGPVYNFSGKGLGQGQSGQVAADNEGGATAVEQMDAARKQIEASNVPADEKAKIDQNLTQARETMNSVSTAGH